jgi:sulfide:quinone oxidoreductase
MMEAKRLDDDVSVSAQITVDDVGQLSELGFRSIICNRPDGEGNDQPTFEETRQAGDAKGLTTRYMPVESGKVRDRDGREFERMMRALPKPILAYCRTGTRSTMLWALAAARRLELVHVLSAVENAGFDTGG